MEIIEFQGRYVPASYLGDGVYAIFDGFGIWLHANDHKNPTDKVYLEPPVMESLERFNHDCRREEVIKLCQEKNRQSGQQKTEGESL